MRALRLCSTLASSLVVLAPLLLVAQGKLPVDTRFAGESFVIDHSDWIYSEDGDGKGFQEHTVAVTIQSEAAIRSLGVISIPFASASEHVEIHYARVRHKDGSVTETPASGAMEQPEEVTRQAPFYSDLKQEQLPVKNLQVGDTLEWQARIVRTRAEAPNSFWGSDSFVDDDFVAREESIELRVPVASAATVWTNPKLGIKPVEKVDGATKIYRWETSQLKPTTGPAAEAAKKAKKTHILTADEEFDAEEGELPSIAWTSFKNWEAVGAWYRGMEGQRAVPDDEIKAKVAELIAGKTTEEDKVRVVYAYVSAQIHYIGVAFGVGRFQPHEAADVLHNQYGDCKDKATLLASMLAVLGLHADSVLIGDGIRFNDAVPSPAAFNHLITRVNIGSNEVWLDATQEVAPYRVLLFELRDKPALVVPETGVATIERTPKDLPFPAVDTWVAKGKLDADGVSESHITMTVRGDDEVILRAVTHQVAPAQYDQLADNFAKALGYTGTVTHPDFSRPEDSAEPFSFSFDYHRERAGDWDNLRIIPQLQPVELPIPDDKELPVSPINLGTPRTETGTSEMKLPDGWTAELPDSIHEKAPFATYDLTYRFDKGTVYADRKLVILQHQVPATDWRAYKKWTDAISLGMETYIPLHRPGNPKSNSASSSINAAQTDLFNQLDAAYKIRDTKAMESLLKKLKSIDPHARRLLAWQGSLAILRNKLDEAIADNEKELQLYPDEIDRYEAILWVERRKDDKPAAEATLRAWANAQPDNAVPLLQLAGLLAGTAQYDDALAAAKQGEARTAEGSAQRDSAIELIGQIQLKSGATAEGKATLVGLIKSTQDPFMLNNCAYELADANIELPLDEASSRAAIDKLSEATADLTVDTPPSNTMKGKLSLLLASWDTMGWILYREGKFKEAESWLEAAHLGRPDKAVEDHLAKERTALGPGHPDPDAGKTEQQLRTLPLGPSGGRVGVTEYRMLIGPDGVEKSQRTGDETLDGADAMLKKADFSRFFPTGSTARLLRTGMINCVAGNCVLVLEP